MSRPSIKAVIDLPNREIADRLAEFSGLYRIEISPARNQRSNRQNRWYWGCIVAAFADYCNEQDYEITEPDQAHEFLKARFLAVTVRCRDTGEVIGRRVRSTTELDTAQFADYCERCRSWLADFFGIVVPDPD